MSKYFYHGIQGQYFGMKGALTILQTGGIKCKRLLDPNRFIVLGYNGNDYVSVCKKEEEYKYYERNINAFYSFVQNSFCFVISNDIEAVKTELPSVPLTEETKKFTRFSDMFDEWQVKDQIPLSSIIGIGIPISEIKVLFKIRPELEKLEEIKQILILAEQLELDIVDSSEFGFVEKYEERKDINGKQYQLSSEQVKGVLYE